jgi:hypothetical protein
MKEHASRCGEVLTGGGMAAVVYFLLLDIW